MRSLDLFAGAGGGLLAGKLLGWTSIGYVEWEPYCQKVLQARIADGYLDAAPIFGDVRKFVSEGYASAYTGMVDVLTAGWPCGPHSMSGKRKASADSADMWQPTADAIRIIRPSYFFGENVPGMLTSEGGAYFGKVLGDLASMGYDAKWGVLSANAEGAPHLRERFWIVANTDKTQCERGRISGRIQTQNTNIGNTCWWQDKPTMARVVDDVAPGLDISKRLEAGGNGQVPIVSVRAWQELSK